MLQFLSEHTLIFTHVIYYEIHEKRCKVIEKIKEECMLRQHYHMNITAVREKKKKREFLDDKLSLLNMMVGCTSFYNMLKSKFNSIYPPTFVTTPSTFVHWKHKFYIRNIQHQKRIKNQSIKMNEITWHKWFCTMQNYRWIRVGYCYCCHCYRIASEWIF